MSPPVPEEPPGAAPGATSEADAASVRGERAAAVVSSLRTMQARASSLLATGLMIALGGGALAWYYSHALTRPSRARESAQASAARSAQSEMALPSLGRIDAPVTPAPQAPAPERPLAELPDEPERTGAMGEVATTPAPAAAVKTPAQLALERRLSGAVFTPGAVAPGTAPATTAAEAMGHGADPGAAAPAATGALPALLVPTPTPAVQAQRLASTRLLLPKGAFIDCTLETAIDSTLPGMTTCITAADIFGADGTVVLLERGTKLVGETRGQVQQGQARVFVLWTQALTPRGVLVPLDSPGADELGRSGLPGEVDRHFWQRFGAGILVSLVDGGVQAAVQSANHSGSTVIYAPSASQDVLTEVFRDTLHIAPTVTKRNGDRIQVLVARDIDFRSVYELHASAAGR